jgi:hypothetical protein
MISKTLARISDLGKHDTLHPLCFYSAFPLFFLATMPNRHEASEEA